jgi:hypothetical protein
VPYHQLSSATMNSHLIEYSAQVLDTHTFVYCCGDRPDERHNERVVVEVGPCVPSKLGPPAAVAPCLVFGREKLKIQCSLEEDVHLSFEVPWYCGLREHSLG